MARRACKISFLCAALAVAVLTLSPSQAFGDGCDDCKKRCRDKQKECKNAAPKPLCKGPAKPVCYMFKNFQCPLAKRHCLSVGCNVGGPCGGGKPSGGGQASGDPHLTTLDGKRYDLQTVGEYVIARSKTADLEVQGRLVPLGASVSVVAVAAVKSAGHVVTFERGKDIVVDQQSPEVVDDTIYVDENFDIVVHSKNRYLVYVGDNIVWVRVNNGSLSVTVDPAPNTKGTWEGLFGDFDGKFENDFKTREGKVFEAKITREILHGEFSDSWRLEQSESFLPYGKGETTETYTDKGFPKAHFSLAGMKTEVFLKSRETCFAKGVRHGEPLRNCIYDIAVTKDEEFAESYADSREVEARSTLTLPGAFAMVVQPKAGQGEFVPVFWSGDSSDFMHASVLSKAGKRITGARKKGVNPLMLRMPAEVGSYVVELKQGAQSTKQDIEVTKVEATLNVPESVGGAEEFKLSWTGPMGRGDYVALVKAGETRPNKHLAYIWAHRQKDPTFQAPAIPGKYEIWYVVRGAGQDTPIAKATITVGAAKATLTPPASVEVGAFADIEWTGPDGKGDYIDVVKASHTTVHGHITYTWTARSKEGKVTLRAPVDAGSYLVRYIASTSAGRAVLTTAPLKVTEAKVELTVTKNVEAGGPIDVTWTGPNHKGDWVAVVKRGEESPHRHFRFGWTTEAGKLTLKAPDEPGAYEVVYVLRGGGGPRILGRQPFEVKAP